MTEENTEEIGANTSEPPVNTKIKRALNHTKRVAMPDKNPISHSKKKNKRNVGEIGNSEKAMIEMESNSILLPQSPPNIINKSRK